jgi:hypothetical protein
MLVALTEKGEIFHEDRDLVPFSAGLRLHCSCPATTSTWTLGVEDAHHP